ncbi:hypothetical protein [Methanobrevibacter sp.]
MIYYINDNDLINDFHCKSGHSNGSIKSYRTVFNKYTQFHKMSSCELLGEAISEQEKEFPKTS